ncbi:MAG: UpxY family transcription antiterminator [Ignavibacteriae bacterium]|nr:UpxY family transcription antiterminator [Ignavibacteriota bacterium]
MPTLSIEPDPQFTILSRWYALYVRSRYEKRTHSELQQLGVESFLPLIEEIHCWSDRKKRVEEPMFRGYVFVHSDLRNKVSILQTEGVVRFVGIRNYPSPIPDDEINWVRILAKSPDAVKREEEFEPGEWVRILVGPFQGVQGFVTMVKGMAKVVVSIPSIGRAVSIQVPIEFVEKVGEEVAVLS